MTPPFLAASRQSPIDVEPALKVDCAQQLSVQWTKQELVFHTDRSDDKTKFEHIANKNASVTLSGEKYLLRELHFHAPSEHFKGERQFDGELHIVHQHPTSARFVVLAFFLVVKRNVPGWIDQFFPSPKPGRPIKQKGSDLAPNREDLASYYLYQGSLTTPPFAETVSWVVFPNPRFVDKATYAYLDKESKGARGLQARDDRFVLLMSRPKRGKS